MEVLSCFDCSFEGEVFCNNISLKRNFNSLKGTMGHVTQDGIIYEKLTLERMLTCSARLRLPKDSDKNEISTRVKNARFNST